MEGLLSLPFCRTTVCPFCRSQYALGGVHDNSGKLHMKERQGKGGGAERGGTPPPPQESRGQYCTYVSRRGGVMGWWDVFADAKEVIRSRGIFGQPMHEFL